MRTLWRDAHDALRGSLRGRPWWAGPRVTLVAAPVVGLAAGSYSVTEPMRAQFMLYSAIKMPLLIGVTTLVCLPAFFVAHLVLGERRIFGDSLRGVLTGQAVFALVIAALAPLIPVWYSMVASKDDAIVGVGVLFAIASLCGLVPIRRRLREAGRARVAPRLLVVAWLVLYAFVAIQCAWMLRPFVGSPELPPAFLRDEALTNGYVVVFRLVFG